MSSTLPTGNTLSERTGEEGTAQVPRPRAMRLRQVLDVSSRPPGDGDSLVYNTDTGNWEPNNVTPGPGSISTDMLQDGAVTGPKIATNAVNSSKLINGSVITSKIEDANVTDSKIGQRTIVDTTAPITDSALLNTLLNSLAYMVRMITGKANWRTAPAINLETLSAHKARHATGGADPIFPTDIGAAAATHTHSNATDTVAGFMSAANKVKLDGIAAGATNTPLSNTLPTSLSVGQTGVTGTSSNAARADHAHDLPGVATISSPGFMSATDKSKLNSVGTLSDSTPATLTVTGSGSAGTSANASRADHVHATPNIATSSASGFMSSTDKAKLDGIASGATNTPLTNTAPSDITAAAQTSFVGTTAFAARADHRHASPGPATASAAGFMPAADKAKVDSLFSPVGLTTKFSTDYTFPQSTARTDLMSLALPANAAGTYLITVSIDLEWNETSSVVMSGQLVYTTSSTSGAGTAPYTEEMIYMSAASTNRITLTYHWVIEHVSSSVRYVWFRPGKTAAGGTTSRIRFQHSRMTAMRIT